MGFDTRDWLGDQQLMARRDRAYPRAGETADKTRPSACRVDHNRRANLAATGDHLGNAAILRTKAGYGGVGEKHPSEFRRGARVASGQLSRLQVKIVADVRDRTNAGRLQEWHQLTGLGGGHK